MAARVWDLFCRVIDNLGDAGVCWRLAADLAARGERVRLVIDDATALAFMAPKGARGVEVLPWPGPPTAADVVVEAFGCDPPAAYLDAMAQRTPSPVWLNLEYLSAESYVERSHGLPSPQRNGLPKWFFYPGYTARTGGLLREPGLIDERQAFDRARWLAGLGLSLRPGERAVSLFCYENPALPDLLEELGRAPTLLLLTPGHAARQVRSARAGLRLHLLPWLTQPDYDRLLWSCDLNFVRGEDTLVRALWAGVPFVWQAYPQQDGAQHAKVEALLARMGAGADVAALWRAWNAGAAGPWPGLPALPSWAAAAARWRCEQLGHPDLATRLLAFVAAAKAGAPGCSC